MTDPSLLMVTTLFAFLGMIVVFAIFLGIFIKVVQVAFNNAFLLFIILVMIMIFG